jgi:hypothetical protein
MGAPILEAPADRRDKFLDPQPLLAAGQQIAGGQRIGQFL